MLLRKSLNIFGFIIFFVACLIVIVHHNDIQSDDFDIRTISFSSILSQLDEFNNNDELHKNYLNSLTFNLSEIKRYLKGNYLIDSSSVYQPSSIIQNDLMIKNSKNFFERIRLSLTNGADMLKSLFNIDSSSQTNFDKFMGFVVGFIPTISAVSVCAFEIGVIGLNYITFFCDIIL